MQKPKNTEQNYHIVEMYENFPFGQLSQTVGEDSEVLVRKKLVCYSQKQLEIMRKMVQFLGSINNEYLINFHHSERGSDNKYYFYYEYAPLTMDKWILDLGDDILEELEFEMLSLANYLTQNGIKFIFDPDCLGLSKDIRVKYFLNEFSVDHERKLANYKEIEEEVIRFFSDFKKRYAKEEVTSSIYDRKSADSANHLGSVTTRESWEVKSSKSSNSARASMTKAQTLNEKIENSKKKSMQILQKLKGLKTTHN